MIHLKEYMKNLDELSDIFQLIEDSILQDPNILITEGNIIKPLASGGTIKPFRCFFEPNTPNVAHARAISIDGMTTAIEDVEWGEGNPFLTPIDNRIYTVSGQYVGDDLDALPKGVYLVNGKKIIK